MNFNRALIVYKKEMLEMFRDKRTIFSTILLPFILYPLIFIGTFSLMSRQTAKLEEKGAVIALADSVNDDASRVIVKAIKDTHHFQVMPYSKSSESLYKEKTVGSIILISDSLQSSGMPVYKVTVKLDKSTDQGKLIAEKLDKAFKSSESTILKHRLAKLGYSTQFISILNVKQQDTSSSQKKLGSLLGAILPYLLIMLLIAGASVVAGDLVAGEKERKTLETLLVSSAHRNEIVLGKYLTIITFALINVAVNLISLYFSIHNIASQSGLQMAGVKFPTSGFLVLFLALIPLATLYAALLLSISTFSRNMKEARSYEQPILLASMFMAMISFFPAIELNNGLALIPVINISLLFKAVLMGDYKLMHLFLTIGSTLILDVIAIIVTIRLFNNEAVLFRSETDLNLKHIRSNKRVIFTPYFGMVYFVLALLALYYVGSAWQAKSIVNGLIKTELILVLLPVLVILRLFKLNIKDNLRLNPTPLANFLIVPFIAIPAAILVTLISQLINQVYPIPPEYINKMNELLKMPDLSLGQVLLLMAVLPGVCEEILFRGFIFRFYETGKYWIPIIASAVLFAVFHLDIYRFIPVLLLGILLGWLMFKSGSIYVSMFSHAINNAIAILIIHFSGSIWLKNILIDNDNITLWIGLPALFLLAAALYVFNKINTKSVLQNA